jgi:hypothetical protein
VLATALTGCSALFSQPPPQTPLDAFDQCSTSRGAPRADLFLAVPTSFIAPLLWVAAARQHESAKDDTVPSWDPRPADGGTRLALWAGLLTVAAAGGVVSSYYGYNSATECEEARSELAKRRGVPPPVEPPWLSR